MSVYTALYPFCAEFMSTVRHFNEIQKDYHLCSLISPSGLGLDGRDASHACNHPPIGLNVTSQLSPRKSKWEILIVAKPLHEKGISDDMLVFAVKSTLDAGKRVVYCDNRALHRIPSEIRALINDSNGRLSFASCSSNPIMPFEDPYQHQPIRTPIIVVGGLIQEPDVSEVLISIARQATSVGMRPLVFANHSVGHIMGFHSISHIFDNTALSEAEKAKAINRAIADIVDLAAPDVVLIEAPDALMRFDENIPNGFGIKSFMLCQAISPDFLVACIPYPFVSAHTVRQLGEDFIHRFGTPLAAIHISNTVVDMIELAQFLEISYVYNNIATVRDKIDRDKASISIPVYNILEETSPEKLLEHLCDSSIGQV